MSKCEFLRGFVGCSVPVLSVSFLKPALQNPGCPRFFRISGQLLWLSCTSMQVHACRCCRAVLPPGEVMLLRVGAEIAGRNRLSPNLEIAPSMSIRLPRSSDRLSLGFAAGVRQFWAIALVKPPPSGDRFGSNGTIVANPTFRCVAVVASYHCVGCRSSNTSRCWLRTSERSAQFFLR